LGILVVDFDGEYDGTPVVTIVKMKKNGEKVWMAKPKDLKNITPDFREKHGVLSVHQDSPNSRYYRSMTPLQIGSCLYPPGQSFSREMEYDIAILPMEQGAKGYTINTSPSGALVSLPADVWCLVAIGAWGPWTPKSQ